LLSTDLNIVKQGSAWLSNDLNMVKQNLNTVKQGPQYG